MTTAERKRLEVLEALHPGGKHPDYAAKVHTHTTPEPPPPPPPPPPTGGVIFEDDFNGSAIDTTKWMPLYQVGDPGYGLDSDFLGNLSQFTVSNGTAKITAVRATTPSGRLFKSACPATKGKFSFLYGTVEARIKYPAGQGVWPAWWTLEQKAVVSSPPEVDLFESYPAPGGAGGGSGVNVMVVSNHHASGVAYFAYDHGSNLTTAFHIHKWVWEPGKMTFYLDGVQIGIITTAVPTVPQYLILTLAVGATGYRADQSATTPSPLVMEIDYVRVWAP